MVEALRQDPMGDSTMPRPLTLRKPTAAEFRRLNQLIEEAPTPRQQRRAHAAVLYYTGMNARDIAAALGVHPNTIGALTREVQHSPTIPSQPVAYTIRYLWGLCPQTPGI